MGPIGRPWPATRHDPPPPAHPPTHADDHRWMRAVQTILLRRRTAAIKGGQLVGEASTVDAVTLGTPLPVFGPQVPSATPPGRNSVGRGAAC